MNVFVTVGSTKFDELVVNLTSDRSQQVLWRLGYRRMVIQYGRGSLNAPHHGKENGLLVEAYDFKTTLEDDLRQADLVISHAGAGTVMECLKLGKRLVVVVNEKLMHNHQAELASEMQARGHSFAATVADLSDVLESADFSTRVSLPPPNGLALAQIVREEYLAAM